MTNFSIKDVARPDDDRADCSTPIAIALVLAGTLLVLGLYLLYGAGGFEPRGIDIEIPALTQDGGPEGR